MWHYTITYEKTIDITLVKVSHGVLGVCLGVSDCYGIERKGSGARRMRGVGRERYHSLAYFSDQMNQLSPK